MTLSFSMAQTTKSLFSESNFHLPNIGQAHRMIISTPHGRTSKIYQPCKLSKLRLINLGLKVKKTYMLNSTEQEFFPVKKCKMPTIVDFLTLLTG